MQTLTHYAPGGGLLSKFDYDYDVEGQIQELTRKLATREGVSDPGRGQS